MNSRDTAGRIGDPKARIYVICSALLALFLGAMDALVVSAAMPTIISDLRGIHLYAWVYSAYFLSRAVSLPVFGKLADLFNTRWLFLFSILIFLTASAAAGASRTMGFLVISRVFQGIGAGGNFALVYIVLSDAALPGKRARTLSFASSIWGIASIIGPTLGGFIVTYFSWRWIFYINVPLGILSLGGIGFFLKEYRKKKKNIHLDLAGVSCLTTFVLGLLILFITGGRQFAWNSVEIMVLACITLFSGIGFYFAEKKAKEPILDIEFFKYRGFAFGNAVTFFSSFAIFSLFAYAPLYIQGALGKTPMEVGTSMLSLSLGWSLASLILGRFLGPSGIKPAAMAGVLLMLAGSGITLGFSTKTTMLACFMTFQIIGLGMGLITLSTLLVVQNCLSEENLGVATSSHQFARSLGGTIGVGLSGGIVTTTLMAHLKHTSQSLPQDLMVQLLKSTEHIFQPEFQAKIPLSAKSILQEAVLRGVSSIFMIVFVSLVVCLICSIFLPGDDNS